jgi:isoquinoline 1-oxidoreductase beta subunit
VQVFWSREEDFLRGFFRPAAVARLEAGFGADGEFRALDTHIASLDTKPRLGGLATLPYHIEAQALHYSSVPRGIRIGSWRSVDMSQNTFFIESFVDESAAHVKRDPLDFRLGLLKSHPRSCRVLEAVASLSEWRTRHSSGRHLGLAFASGWDSLAAHVAEAVVTDGRLRITKIFAAVDCGTAVNPDNIVAQMQGGILMAFSAAMAEEITIREGRVQQTGFESYPILRLSQAPEIEVRILESPDAPVGGIGEVGVPPTAPAVANAVFAATGTRVRAMPFLKDARVRWNL